MAARSLERGAIEKGPDPPAGPFFYGYFLGPDGARHLAGLFLPFFKRL
jgi:hypothetical protein